jgi:uncharacterized protein
MTFHDLPQSAAWEHRDSRRGFEVVFLSPPPHRRAEGHAAAVEGQDAWTVQYLIELTTDWATSRALVRGRSASGPKELRLEGDGAGRWRIDGRPAAHLDDCLDVDLESSCLTNAFPVQRLALEVGDSAQAPAVYVRALDLSVGRLEQRYTRLEDLNGAERYRYEAPAFDFEAELVYDASGLVVDYPGIGRRVA